uniref:Uncharacterized protein n=1 Tax=Ananas comosus var. bracteatus TaxID=296719 RepID=A0A6V7PF72_ANACO|nr:unnamed protein product [Ananas comosus var. bracteatus]
MRKLFFAFTFLQGTPIRPPTLLRSNVIGASLHRECSNHTWIFALSGGGLFRHITILDTQKSIILKFSNFSNITQPAWANFTLGTGLSLPGDRSQRDLLNLTHSGTGLSDPGTGCLALATALGLRATGPSLLGPVPESKLA